jgi:hypothetical protein
MGVFLVVEIRFGEQTGQGWRWHPERLSGIDNAQAQAEQAACLTGQQRGISRPVCSRRVWPS